MATQHIPYGRQNISEEDIRAVVKVLRGDWLTQGPHLESFERAVGDYCGTPHVLTIANATAGLHIACLALGVGPGDLVWTSANSFVASSNCALYCGAEVDFVDIDLQTYNMSVAALEEKLEAAKAKGRLPKVVIPVHFAGHSCDMKAIFALSKKYGFAIIEDASHALGAEYDQRKVGYGQYSDIVIFSLHPVKMITSGEGGLMLTRNPQLHHKMKLLRTHGITRNPAEMRSPDEGAWFFEQQMLGYNYRMTDIQAALGESQLKRLEDFVVRRRQLVDQYNTRLAALPLELPTEISGVKSSYHLYVVRLKNGTPEARRKVFDEMRAQGILVNVHYAPIYWQPYYQTMGFKQGLCPQAEAYYNSALTLPLFYGLSDSDQEQVVLALKKALEKL